MRAKCVDCPSNSMRFSVNSFHLSIYQLNFMRSTFTPEKGDFERCSQWNVRAS